jgi:hypothetical protein
MAGNRVRSPKTEVPKLGCAFRGFRWQLPLVRQRDCAVGKLSVVSPV